MQHFGRSVEAKCLTEGLMMHSRAVPGDAATGAKPTLGGWVMTPITLQPLVLSKNSFEYALALSPLWAQVIDRVAQDTEFLIEAIEPIAVADPFTAKILDLYKKVYTNQQGRTSLPQKAFLGIFRSDYMRDDPAVQAGNHKTEWKNIEINTIACSFPAQSSKIGRIQKYIQKLKQTPSCAKIAWSKNLSTETGDIQVSDSLQQVALGLVAGHKHWEDKYMQCKALQALGVKPVVCFVVDDGERNTVDQQTLAMECFEAHGVPCVRKSFTDLEKEMTFVENDNAADAGEGLKAPPHPVLKEAETGADIVISVFYYRTGYLPEQYPTEESWNQRLRIEQTSGLKCPSMAHQLCGWKQIQQLLSQEAVLSKFATPEEKALLQPCMVGQFRVMEHMDTAVPRAIANPDTFVLKSQLEGGGNLYYGNEMKVLLEEAISPTPANPARAEFTKNTLILMERIVSTEHGGSIMKPDGSIHHFDALIPELGIYGVVLSEGKDKVHFNRTAGYLLRTKPHGVSDGGIMSGAAALDVVAYKH